MTLHLIKLCVGAKSVDDLKDWIAFRLAQMEAAGVTPEQFHTTRQMPKAREDILSGGSLYWVMGGAIQCRQKVLDLRAFEDDEGISRCNIILEPVVHLVKPYPRRPFQGWRYLKADDAPPDMARDEAAKDMPLAMQRELSELGLI